MPERAYSYLDDIEDIFAELDSGGSTVVDDQPISTTESFKQPAEEQPEHSYLDDIEQILSDTPEQDNRFEITKGLTAGYHQTIGLLDAFVGIGGDLIGSDSLRDWGIEGYRDRMEQAGKSEARIKSYADVESFEDGFDFVMHGVGTLIPIFVPSLVSGGVGVIAARKATSIAVKRLVESEVKRNVAKGIAEKEALKLATKTVAEQSGKKIAKIHAVGALGGAAGGSIPLESGGIYAEIFDETGEYRPGAALGFGTAAGLLDAIAPVKALAKIGFGKVAKEGIKDIIKESASTHIGKQILIEMTTEGFQTVIERAAIKWVDNNKEMFGPDQREEIINSMILGGFGGLVLGGGAHGIDRALSGNQEEQNLGQLNPNEINEIPDSAVPDLVSNELPADDPNAVINQPTGLPEAGDPNAVINQPTGLPEAGAQALPSNDPNAVINQPTGLPEASEFEQTPPATIPDSTDALTGEVNNSKPAVSDDTQDALSNQVNQGSSEATDALNETMQSSFEETDQVSDEDYAAEFEAVLADETLTDEQLNAEIDETVKNEAQLSPENDMPEPPQSQQEDGTYRKAHHEIQGVPVSIENPKGSKRKGTNEAGKKWSIELQDHYGYIENTVSADGDPIDVFIGENPTSEKIFVVDQVNPETGAFDEAKVIMGALTEEQATETYNRNYEANWKGLGAITEMSIEEFKQWAASDASTKPIKPIEQSTTVEEDIISKGVEILESSHNRPLSDINLTEFIRTIGGIDKQEAIDNGIDPADIKAFNKEFPGKPIFRLKGGLSMDGLAERLNEEGAPTPYGPEINAVQTADYVADVIRGVASGEHTTGAVMQAPEALSLPNFEDIKDGLGISISNAKILAALKTEKPNAQQNRVKKEFARQIREDNDEYLNQKTEDTFELSQDTDTDRVSREELQKKQDKETEQESIDTLNKADADREVATFKLTGSSSIADVAEANGQKSLLDQKQEVPISKIKLEREAMKPDGNVVTMRQSAPVAIKNMDKRLATAQKLLQCVNS